MVYRAHGAFGQGRRGGGDGRELPSPLMVFNIYVLNIFSLTFQTSGDTWPAAFY